MRLLLVVCRTRARKRQRQRRGLGGAARLFEGTAPTQRPRPQWTGVVHRTWWWNDGAWGVTSNSSETLPHEKEGQNEEPRQWQRFGRLPGRCSRRQT